MDAQQPTGATAKVQPKLRMVANGSTEVNALRAEHASAVKVPKAVASSVELLRTQSATPVEQRQLPRVLARPKLRERPRARVSAFVQLTDDPREWGAGGDLPGETARKANLRTVELSADDALALGNRPSVVSVELGQPLSLPDQQVTRARGVAPSTALRRVPGRTHRSGEGVLMGLIDVGGFDFTHPDFLDRRRHPLRADLGPGRCHAPVAEGARHERVRLRLGAAQGGARPRDRARGRRGPAGLRARAAVADVAGLPRHSCGQHRRRQPRRLRAGPGSRAC